MAKYRHRIFEMYEFREEAIGALTPKTAPRLPEPAPDPESWQLKHLEISHGEGVTHLEFRNSQSFGDETVSDLREDFAQLAENLPKNSKVLLDFVGAETFCAAAIQELVQFNQKLKNKGSRIALCCLDPKARQSFFAA